MIIEEEDVGSWETIMVHSEFEDVNPITVRMLDRDFKYIYTFIKKNSPVKAIDIFNRFPKMDVEHILYDLRLLHLVYFSREVKQYVRSQ